MKKITKILSFALAFVCISLCLVGCDFSFGGDETTLSSIDLSSPFQTEFCIGDTLDLTGKKLILTYSDDTQEEILLTESMFFQKLDTTTATTTQQRSIGIKYKGKTITSNYTVLNAKRIGSNILYFDRVYRCTTVELYKNDVYVGQDDSNVMLGNGLILRSNGVMLNVGESKDDVLVTGTWSINTDNTISLSADGQVIMHAIALDGRNNLVVSLRDSDRDSTYDTIVQTYSLQAE